MSRDDREEIERKTQALEQASTAIMQKMYEQSAGSAAGRGFRVRRRATGSEERGCARRGVRRGQGKRPQEGLKAGRGSMIV